MGVESIGVHPLRRRCGTSQNDGKCETDGLGSHLVLLSTRKVLAFSGSVRAQWGSAEESAADTLRSIMTLRRILHRAKGRFKEQSPRMRGLPAKGGRRVGSRAGEQIRDQGNGSMADETTVHVFGEN